MSTQKYKISVMKTHTDPDGNFRITPTDNCQGWNIFEYDPFTASNGLLIGVVPIGYPGSSNGDIGKNAKFDILRRHLGLSMDEIHACKDSRIHGAHIMKAVNPNPAYISDPAEPQFIPQIDEDIEVVIVEWFD